MSKLAHDKSDILTETVQVDGQSISRGLVELLRAPEMASEGSPDPEPTQETQEVDGAVRAFLEDTRAKTTVRTKGGMDEVNLKHYKSLTDWVMNLLLVGIRHAVPELDNEQAAELAQVLFRQLGNPQTARFWIKPIVEIKRVGMKQAIAKAMLELSRGYWD